MTARSLFPEGVEVHQDDLVREHTALAAEILTRFLDSARSGVMSGLTVFVSGVAATTVGIVAGWGYAPNAERIDLPSTQTTVPLSDSSTGTVNYVFLVYTETESDAEAHESLGVTRTTSAARSYRVVVKTIAGYAAMLATSADLSLDAKDRALLVGVVTGAGIGVNLTQNNITNAPTYSSVLSIQQPTSITGISIVALDPLTTTTQAATAAATAPYTATLTYTPGATPPTSATLSYRAPGDAGGAGPAVTFASGPFPPDVETTYTLISNNALFITFKVFPNLLPAIANAAATIESLTVSDVYYDAVPHVSTKDDQHRHELGSVIPATTNPHGLAPEDLVRGSLNVPWTVKSGTGLLSTLAQALIPHRWAKGADFTVSERTYLDELVLTTAAGTMVVRAYITPSAALGGGIEFTVNAKWTQNNAGTKRWVKDINGLASMKLSLNSGDAGGVFSIQSKAVADNAAWSDTGWTSAPLQALPDLGQFLVAAQLFGGVEKLSNGTDALLARFVAKYAAGGGIGRTCLFESYPSSGGTTSTLRQLRVYMTQNVAAGQALEVTWNARWDGAQWVRDTGSDSWCARFGNTKFETRYHAAATATPWNDTVGAGGWDYTGFSVDDAAAQNSFASQLTIGSALVAAAPLVPRLQFLLTNPPGTRTIAERADIFKRYFNSDAENHQDIVIGATWNGAQWTDDGAGLARATRIRLASDGIIFQSRALPSAPWTDAADDVLGWTQEFELRRRTGKSVLYNSRLRFDAILGTTTTNPTAGTALLNEVCAKTLTKTWGYLTGSAGAITNTEGANFTAVLNGTNQTDCYVQITFPNGGLMTDARYHVDPHNHTMPLNTTAASVDRCRIFAYDLQPNGFKMRMVINGAGVSYVDLIALDWMISFSVIGTQVTGV